jgi:type IV secretory pathway protease TraF
MLKFIILSVASLALVGTAVAADLPRPQPVAAAPAPVGKYPVGKSPVGKYPVAAPAPVVTKG